jgi:PleD family two-component response regulator
MRPDPFVGEDFRLLTREAFDFVLNNELKRAVRSQNFLTLLLVAASPSAVTTGGAPTAPGPSSERAVREVARLVSRDVRETDLLAQTEEGQLSIVLLDADLPSSLRVVDRLTARFEHYEFPTPLSIEVGAACCPTHGADVESLRRAAEARPVYPRGESRGNRSTAN